MRGELAEAAVLKELLRRDFRVLVPFGHDHAYDLAVDIDDRTMCRIQCKTGWFRDNCIVFNTCSTDHGRGRSAYHGKADVFGIYAPWLDQVYMVPVAGAPDYAGRLRLTATRNRQTKGVRFASDFGIDQWSPLETLSPAA